MDDLSEYELTEDSIIITNNKGDRIEWILPPNLLQIRQRLASLGQEDEYNSKVLGTMAIIASVFSEFCNVKSLEAQDNKKLYSHIQSLEELVKSIMPGLELASATPLLTKEYLSFNSFTCGNFRWRFGKEMRNSLQNAPWVSVEELLEHAVKVWVIGLTYLIFLGSLTTEHLSSISQRLASTSWTQFQKCLTGLVHLTHQAQQKNLQVQRNKKTTSQKPDEEIDWQKLFDEVT